MDISHATCHWHTPTRILPHTYSFEAGSRPWTCLRDNRPRPLDMSELHQYATCADRRARTFESAKRDLVFETWGVGVPGPEARTFDDVRRDLVWEAWGVA